MKGVNDEFSTKRVAFVLAILTGLIAPTILVAYNTEFIGDYLTYMAIVIPVIIGAYVGGKAVDKMPNKNGIKSNLEFKT